jgi:hypothetical protein
VRHFDSGTTPSQPWQFRNQQWQTRSLMRNTMLAFDSHSNRKRHCDVQQLFTADDGQPDLVNLLRWANQNNDPDALQLAVIRPALSEVAARLGIMGPNEDVIAVFVQTTAMRPKPRFVVGGALWDLAEVWNRRPDLRQRFSANGVVNVRRVFTWASTVPTTDPDFDSLRAVAGHFDQLLSELPPTATP